MDMNDAKSIFGKAQEFAAPALRAAYVEEACGGDAALRAEVERLLAAADEAGGFMAKPAVATFGTAAYQQRVAESPGTMIGPYKLMEQIGEGGFGLVFVAEQHRPVRRKVALKIIKPGMDTRACVARFEAERQALALMDHPNIAKVFDAGTTESGRPYFVMELVRGVPITDFCDQQRLTPRERLDLFISVCQAIQHAHQKGIIHRDVKPTNVLVTQHDGRPVVKVIDFGVAKALSQQLTERTIYTQFAQMIGTPLYMSPEQAEMSGLDIDTRSDIYSLGVLLYELLTGTTPFDRQRMSKAAAEEIRRIIREEEPPKPSTRISQSGDRLASTAALRGTEPAKLSKLVRGDLDWIVMKCLEKDRNRRYETANGLARDIERYMANEAVQACPPSTMYRFRKFARRNKAALATAAIVTAALLSGTWVSVWQAVRATRAERTALLERDEKEIARREAVNNARRSRAEAAKATAINDLLLQMLRSANPEAARGSDYTVRQMLDDFSIGLAQQLQDQPEAKAAIYATIGNAYRRLVVPEKAEPHLQAALELRERLHGHESAEVADTLVDFAWVAIDQRDIKAEALARQALEIQEKLRLPEEKTIRARHALAFSLRRARKLTESHEQLEEILAIARRHPGDYPEVADVMHWLSDKLIREGDYVGGEQMARKAISLHRKLQGEDHPETAWGLNTLANALFYQKKFGEAERYYLEAIAIFRKHHRDIDYPILFVSTNLARVARAKNDATTLTELRARCDQLVSLGSSDRNAWMWGGNLSVQLGQWENAEQCFTRLIEMILEETQGKASTDAVVQDHVAWFLATWLASELRDPERVAELASQALQMAPSDARIWCTLGVARYRAGDWQAAIEALNKSKGLRNGGNSMDWFFLAMAEWQLGNKDAAREWYDKAVQWMEKNQPQNEELIRVSAEAAELLGLSPAADRHSAADGKGAAKE
jgi:serine/threonine protein kinase/tetratricopeptide (TPR) repeat protein